MAEPSASFLGPAQRKLVGFAITLAAFLAIFVLFALVLMGLTRALGFFSGVLWPLATATILALILRPAADLLERRTRLNRLWSVVILFAGFLLSVAGVLLAIIPVLVSQALDFAHTLPQLWEQVSTFVRDNYPGWIAYGKEQLQNPTVKQFVDGVVAEGRNLLSSLLPGLKVAGAGVLNAVGFLAGLAIIPVYLFFFLLSRGDWFAKLGDHFGFLRAEVREDVIFLVREFVAIVVAFFRGQILIGFIMGVMFGIGFSIGGLKFGLVIGLSTGILNIIPYLGSIIGLSVAIPLAFFQPEGGLWLVGVVLAVFTAVQAIEGWVLTPRIMGSSTGLHPVTIIIAIFFWGTALGGLLGMILAIPLTAFLVTAWRLILKKYLHAEPAKAID
ncbi:MAG TPA: AI-2E family transporter [Opitutaceae bacterium]|nr:AI-2E family transporter [Opitutaceae bacterium]